MDYSLGALKILCSHLTTATEATSHSQPAFSLGGILFQRAWLQGVLVSKPSPSNDAGRFLLDDGTGVIELKLSGDYLQNDAWELGMYVMVVGGYAVRKNGTSFIKCGSSGGGSSGSGCGGGGGGGVIFSTQKRAYTCLYRDLIIVDTCIRSVEIQDYCHQL
uniref:Uncharacterized protein n=1 Tax=Ipomoea trifida TaxID=35884 RepID=A0A956_IPOTF|nr:hypothetical protein [Ipomoea trifida]